MSKENGSLTASKVAPSLSILSESFDGASQEKDDSSESEASSLAEEKPWSPADYPDPTLEENMGAGIFYKWEHLEYQTFEDTAVAEVIGAVNINGYDCYVVQYEIEPGLYAGGYAVDSECGELIWCVDDRGPGYYFFCDTAPEFLYAPKEEA
jgi:hypothetical protein